ncbi:MAG: hyfG [Rhodospirillaceae bacterium]|nr:MAG: hyfG [Rhodospirillaceae bacterium]
MTLPETLLTWLTDKAGLAPQACHHPWPRFEVSEAEWQELIEQMAISPWPLLGLWAEPARIYLALRDDTAQDIAVISLPCPGGRFPAVSVMRPAAQRLERAVHDLFGLKAIGLVDSRPWLDHGVWGISQPLASSPDTATASRRPYPFLPVEGEGVHQIPVGPVHAGIIEPGHFRFHANGEAVVRLEARLGYVHKGIEGLMQGRSVAEAALIAARISGDSTVAYSLAFAQAVEAALALQVPLRAVWLRALMAEMERIANHLGDIGAICNDAAFPLLLTRCHGLREQVARTAATCFGHRLMMDRIVPGGVATDLSSASVAAVRRLVAVIEPAFAHLMTIYDDRNSLLDRMVGTGTIGSHLVHRFGTGGFIGRAAMRDFDARRAPSYPPYDDLDFVVPVLEGGDVNARVGVRRVEVEESMKLIKIILDRLPDGPIMTTPVSPSPAGEGMALVEGFRGEILVWVRLTEAGTVARCHARDPSWFQWPLLEAAIEGNIVADFPLCNKSFNCSYAGHDL